MVEEGRVQLDLLGGGASGPNEFGETGLSGTGTCDTGKDVTGSGSHGLRIEIYV